MTDLAIDTSVTHPPFRAPLSPAEARRAVAAASVGNALEFYDFVTFAFFAIQIGHTFFPGGSAYLSLMGALATFGAGFITRPIGAWVLGGYADRVGRKPAMLFSMTLMGVSIAALYLLVNVAMLHVLSPAQIAGSSMPAADAAKLALGGSGELTLTAFAVLSLAAICNLAIMKSTRIAFALSRSGYLPKRLRHVASSGTPRAALTASVVFAAAFASTGTYRTILAADIPVSMSLVILVNLSAARLRQKEPNLPRPFRMPLFPLPVAIAIAVNLALLTALIFADILHSLEGFMFLGSIGLIYSAVRWVRTRSEALAAGEPP